MSGSQVRQHAPSLPVKLCRAFERPLVAGNRWLLIAMLLTMACIVFANVVLRYTTGESLVWGDEVSRHLMIWVTFLGSGLVLRFGGHVAVDSLHAAVRPPLGRAIRVVIVAGIAIFCIAMAYISSLYVWATRFQTTAATDISIAWIYLAMPIGFLLLLLHLLFIAPSFIATGSYAPSDELDPDSAASL
jgi:TRAP-type C4-dicarboxylate transport system permease small subunit